MRDSKRSTDVESMTPLLLADYGRSCAGQGSARMGDRTANASYLGRSDTAEIAVTPFAEAYADQNERDYSAFSGWQ